MIENLIYGYKTNEAQHFLVFRKVKSNQFQQKTDIQAYIIFFILAF